MILADHEILAAMDRGALMVDPWESWALQPAGIEVHLGNETLSYKAGTKFIDPRRPVEHLMERRTMHETGVLIAPGAFLLAATVERITLDATLVGRVEGKSSLGRLGLAVHVTAGFIDPGFDGEITLEIVNMTQATMRLYPGMPIAQVAIHELRAPASCPYGLTGASKYQGQTGPTASRYYLNFPDGAPESS